MAYANKDRRNATSAARKAKLGRTIDFDYVIPTGKNVGMTVRALFLDKMAKSPDKCWHWLGKLFSNGYGSFNREGLTIWRTECLLSYFTAGSLRAC